MDSGFDGDGLVAAGAALVFSRFIRSFSTSTSCWDPFFVFRRSRESGDGRGGLAAGARASEARGEPTFVPVPVAPLSPVTRIAVLAHSDPLCP